MVCDKINYCFLEPIAAYDVDYSFSMYVLKPNNMTNITNYLNMKRTFKIK